MVCVWKIYFGILPLMQVSPSPNLEPPLKVMPRWASVKIQHYETITKAKD